MLSKFYAWAASALEAVNLRSDQMIWRPYFAVDPVPVAGGGIKRGPVMTKSPRGVAIFRSMTDYEMEAFMTEFEADEPL